MPALQAARQRHEAWLVPRCLEALAEAALAEGDRPAALAHADELQALAARGQMGDAAETARRLQQLAAQGALGQ